MKPLCISNVQHIHLISLVKCSWMFPQFDIFWKCWTFIKCFSWTPIQVENIRKNIGSSLHGMSQTHWSCRIDEVRLVGLKLPFIFKALDVGCPTYRSQQAFQSIVSAHPLNIGMTRHSKCGLYTFIITILVDRNITVVNNVTHGHNKVGSPVRFPNLLGLPLLFQIQNYSEAPPEKPPSWSG